MVRAGDDSGARRSQRHSRGGGRLKNGPRCVKRFQFQVFFTGQGGSRPTGRASSSSSHVMKRHSSGAGGAFGYTHSAFTRTASEGNTHCSPPFARRAVRRLRSTQTSNMALK